MDAEAGNRRTAPSARDGEIFQIDLITDFRDAPAGARSGGYSPRNGSAIEFGEQRLVLLKGIGLLRIDLCAQAAALKEPGNTAVNAIGHAGHFGISGRSHTPEHDFAYVSDNVDTIQRHYV
jgi:hypothetical protein